MSEKDAGGLAGAGFYRSCGPGDGAGISLLLLGSR